MTTLPHYVAAGSIQSYSLIWINFDRHALLNLFHKARGRFVADKDEIRPQYQRMDAPDANAIFSSSVVRNTGLSIGDTIDKLDAQVQDIYGMNELAEPWYSDQILPFDITLAGANEYGARAAAKTCVGACRTRVPAAASPMPEPRGRLRS